MELRVGLKFKIFFNETNINNIPYCEVRGIVDSMIILLCEKNGKQWYKMIDKGEFEFFKDKYIEIN
jgi:hypothetical protein